MHSAAFITLLNVLVLIFAMALVGRARGKYGIKAPAITGNDDFERSFRAHQNTLEQTVMFLPVLWIASLNGFEMWAHFLGAAWILSRVWYIVAYNKSAASREWPFMIGAFALVALLGLSAWGLYQNMH